METTLHRQLKALYCDDADQHEVRVDGFRIDAVADGRLIEIQQAGLSALRSKVRVLLASHRVTVVKPLVARRVLVRRNGPQAPVHSTRVSNKHATRYDVFEDLVHFVNVFPHQRLRLDVLLTEQEEFRIVTGRRRRRDKGYRVEDRRLIGVLDRYTLRHRGDLRKLLPASLPEPFSTEDIAQHAGIARWLAQKAAYCLRKTGTAVLVGKSGNSLLYRWNVGARRAA